MSAVTFDTFQSELKIDIAELRMAVKSDIAAVETKIEAAKSDILKWMFGGFIAIITMLAGVIIKLMN